MKEYQMICIASLERNAAGLRPVTKPTHGWLRAVRKGLGISQVALARKLNVTPATIARFEKADSQDALSAEKLSRVAGALGCELVIGLVPKHGRSFRELAELNDPEAEHRRQVAHSMALEGQSVETPAAAEENCAAAVVAIEALLKGFGLSTSAQLAVLRRVAERIVLDPKQESRG